MDLNSLLRASVETGASDIHLKIDKPPMLRRDGSLGPLDGWPALGENDLTAALQKVAGHIPARLKGFYDTGDLDISYQDEDLPRFRVNAYRQRGAISFAFRVIPKTVPNFEQLNLPAGVERLANEHRGLILVTGATGSGKTTTLAAMIDYMNRNRKQHIITIEDPIEILHPDHNCIVNQREVGIDTENFGQALRRALRQDPDTILIGELRDAETAQTALQAAESGHLVMSTLHTIDAAETVGRMIEFFPPEKQEVIRSIMAGVLRGIISQRLLPKVTGGRVAALEVMVMNARISDLIREGKAEEVTDAIGEGEYFQMQTFTQSLIEHVLNGNVDREVAADAATNKHDFLVSLEQAIKRKKAADAEAEKAAEQAQQQAEQGLAPALHVAGEPQLSAAPAPLLQPPPAADDAMPALRLAPPGG
jgi:twitching motility protein PilT